MTTETAIEAVGVQRVYGSTPALTEANLTVGPGEIHALLGENGAGKSTLVRLLAGLEQPDGGEIRLFGRPAATLSKAARAELGIAFIHQDLGLVESLSAADNVALGQPYPTRFGLIRTAALRSRARTLFASLGATIDLDRPVGELPPAEQAIVAIARAIGVGARIIVLDEPTARLHAGEVRGLFALLSRLRDSGVACLLITHRLDDVLAVCDRVTVLRDGRTAGVRGRAELDLAELVSLIVGRAAAAPASAPPRSAAGSPVLSVHGLQGVGYGPLDLRVGEGEIVGLTGLADAGHDQVALALVGAAPAAAGRIEVDGTPRTLASPAAALRAGIGYVPADRRADGLAMSLTAGENIFLAGRGPDGAGRRLRRRAERAAATDVLDRFGVRPAEPGRVVDTFSGGNQQKILLARTLGSRPRLLVLHEPTAAVDVGARSDIYALLRARCVQERCGALVVTSDLEEAANLCDRVVVLQRGQLVGDLAGPHADIDTITTLAYGGAL